MPHPSNRVSCAPRMDVEIMRNQDYNRFMIVGIFAMRVLEVMFFTGMAGSAIVVLTIAVRMLFNSMKRTARPL
jgi:hypothetical protein